MEDMKPDPVLRSVLAHEDVCILSDKQVKNLSQDKLEILLDYYKTTLEILAGKQVWDIIDSLKCAQIEKFNRNKIVFKKAI